MNNISINWEKILLFSFSFLILANIIMFLYIFGIYALLILIIILLISIIIIMFFYIYRFKNIIEAMETCVNDSMDRVNQGIDIHTSLIKEMPYIEDQPAMIKMSRNLSDIKQSLIMIPINVSNILKENNIMNQEDIEFSIYDDEKEDGEDLNKNYNDNITSYYNEESEEDFMKRLEDTLNAYEVNKEDEQP